MSDKAEVIELFKRIQQGLKKYTIKELNEAMEKVLNTAGDKQEHKQKQIAVVMDAVCNEYEISKHQLIYSTARGEMQQAKAIAYCLLHYQLHLPIRYIAKRVFFLKWHNSVGVAVRYYRNLNTSLKPDKEFNDRLEKIKVQIFKQLLTLKTDKI